MKSPFLQKNKCAIPRKPGLTHFCHTICLSNFPCFFRLPTSNKKSAARLQLDLRRSATRRNDTLTEFFENFKCFFAINQEFLFTGFHCSPNDKFLDFPNICVYNIQKNYCRCVFFGKNREMPRFVIGLPSAVCSGRRPCFMPVGEKREACP